MMLTSHKQEFMASLNGGNGGRGDDPPEYRSPHRRRYPDGCPLPPSSAEMQRQRGPGMKPHQPMRDANGRFVPRSR